MDKPTTLQRLQQKRADLEPLWAQKAERKEELRKKAWEAFENISKILEDSKELHVVAGTNPLRKYLYESLGTSTHEVCEVNVYHRAHTAPFMGVRLKYGAANPAWWCLADKGEIPADISAESVRDYGTEWAATDGLLAVIATYFEIPKAQ